MFSILSGVAVFGAGIGGLWYCKPQQGRVQWFIQAPVLEWLVPTAIVTTLAVGLALVVSGVVG
jgi:hypothetical protein